MPEHHLTEAILAAIPATGSATTIEIAAKTGINRFHCARLCAELDQAEVLKGVKHLKTYLWRHVKQPPETECNNADLINS